MKKIKLYIYSHTDIDPCNKTHQLCRQIVLHQIPDNLLNPLLFFWSTYIKKHFVNANRLSVIYIDNEQCCWKLPSEHPMLFCSDR